jgi:uncharacterized membrane protein
MLPLWLKRGILVALLSTLPITELRGSIPIALTVYNLSSWEAYIWALIGNSLPVIILLHFLEPFSLFLSNKFSFFHTFFNWLFERTRRKHSRKFEIFEEFALVLFVAIPLPMTGGWSGALAAFVFGIPFKKAFPLIFLGLCLSGLIVLATTQGIRALF